MAITTLLDEVNDRLDALDSHITAIENDKAHSKGTIRAIKLAAYLLVLQQKRNQLLAERITLD